MEEFHHFFSDFKLGVAVNTLYCVSIISGRTVYQADRAANQREAVHVQLAKKFEKEVGNF